MKQYFAQDIVVGFSVEWADKANGPAFIAKHDHPLHYKVTGGVANASKPNLGLFYEFDITGGRPYCIFLKLDDAHKLCAEHMEGAQLWGTVAKLLAGDDTPVPNITTKKELADWLWMEYVNNPMDEPFLHFRPNTCPVDVCTWFEEVFGYPLYEFPFAGDVLQDK